MHASPRGNSVFPVARIARFVVALFTRGKVGGTKGFRSWLRVFCANSKAGRCGGQLGDHGWKLERADRISEIVRVGKVALQKLMLFLNFDVLNLKNLKVLPVHWVLSLLWVL